jgi:hypothetical protein
MAPIAIRRRRRSIEEPFLALVSRPPFLLLFDAHRRQKTLSTPAHAHEKKTTLETTTNKQQQTAYRRAVASARRETSTKRAPGATAGGGAGSRGLSEEQKQEIR